MDQLQKDLPKTEDLSAVDISQLVDIRNIQIDLAKEKDERIKEFVTKIRNPYCFRCHNMIVRVSFSSDGKPFQELLQNYFNSLS